MELNDLQAKIHKTAVEHGWWETQEQQGIIQRNDGMTHTDTVLAQRSFGELCALVHSEVSEALEAYRERGLEEWTEYPASLVTEVGVEHAAEVHPEAGKPEGAFTELGGAIIRILDMAGFYGVDMQEVIERKMAFNETRSYRHGGKKL